MKNVMASVAETEMGAFIVNWQKVMILRTILEEMSHSQPPIPIRTDNSIAYITNNTIRQQKSR